MGIQVGNRNYLWGFGWGTSRECRDLRRDLGSGWVEGIKYESSNGIGYGNLLVSVRNRLLDTSVPLMEREATAREFSAIASQAHDVLTERRNHISSMTKKGFPPCVVNCYGRGVTPECSMNRSQYDSMKEKSRSSVLFWSAIKEEFEDAANALSEQGDSLISDQQALTRLNRIQADSKQAQAEADQKALIADITRIGIAVVSVVAVFFLYKYISKFVK